MVAVVKTHIHTFHFFYRYVRRGKVVVYNRSKGFCRVERKLVFTVGGRGAVIHILPAGYVVGIVVFQANFHGVT